MCLPAQAYDDLAALQELREMPLCKRCRHEQLQKQLRRTCEVCGETFEDPQVAQLLKEPY